MYDYIPDKLEGKIHLKYEALITNEGHFDGQSLQYTQQ
jgi:hypothetical protein